jgi:hypothetical protein
VRAVNIHGGLLDFPARNPFGLSDCFDHSFSYLIYMRHITLSHPAVISPGYSDNAGDLGIAGKLTNYTANSSGANIYTCKVVEFFFSHFGV